MRATSTIWWCYSGHSNRNGERECSTCGKPRFERHALVHVSDRAVVYRHPVSGEYKTPARADQPMPEVYAREGFERHEILNMTDWEKRTGAVHEASNCNSGNSLDYDATPQYKAPKHVVDSLCRDIAEAAASGPWTGADTLV